MVKVLIGLADCVCINATTVLESTPPDKNAPKGTSATICWRMASLARASNASTASLGVPKNGWFMPASATWAVSQYFKNWGSGWSRDTVNKLPGSSFAIPWYIEYGAGM